MEIKTEKNFRREIGEWTEENGRVVSFGELCVFVLDEDTGKVKAVPYRDLHDYDFLDRKQR